MPFYANDNDIYSDDKSIVHRKVVTLQQIKTTYYDI